MDYSFFFAIQFYLQDLHSHYLQHLCLYLQIYLRYTYLKKKLTLLPIHLLQYIDTN